MLTGKEDEAVDKPFVVCQADSSLDFQDGFRILILCCSESQRGEAHGRGSCGRKETAS